MLFHRQPVSLRIDIPVDDFLPSHPTPDEVVSAKRASLSTPRTAKSPEELARAEKMSGLLYKAHIEAVQARAAREGERAREAKARRLRHEESERQRLQARLDRAASRDKCHGEAKATEAASKALLRTQRAEEARKARTAAEAERAEKLASLSARVEESAERKSKLMAATQAKNAHWFKRALAVVAAHKEQQREAAQASAMMLETKFGAAAERRTASMSYKPNSGSRAELVKAAVETTKLEQALRIKRALEAAAERRESTLGQRIEKARSELSRVQAAIELKEAAAAAQLVAARRSHFAKLNDADVRVQLSRQSRQTKPPVAFEVASGDGSAAGQLPAAVIDRLQIKTRRSPLAPATDLATRKSITANARAAFARKDLAAVDAALAASKVKAAALKTATEAAARRGAAIARSAIIARAAKAKAMNARVGKAAVRRHASRARKSASLGRKALCAQAASGRRAAALVARATKAGSTDRATAVAAKRKKMDAAREARGHVLHLRALAAYMVAAERLAQKSSSASRRGPPPAVEVSPPADEWQVVVPHDEAAHSSCVVA